MITTPLPPGIPEGVPAFLLIDAPEKEKHLIVFVWRRKGYLVEELSMDVPEAQALRRCIEWTERFNKEGEKMLPDLLEKEQIAEFTDPAVRIQPMKNRRRGQGFPGAN
jgi:hypothetical protein